MILTRTNTTETIAVNSMRKAFASESPHKSAIEQDILTRYGSLRLSEMGPDQPGKTYKHASAMAQRETVQGGPSLKVWRGPYLRPPKGPCVTLKLESATLPVGCIVQR